MRIVSRRVSPEEPFNRLERKPARIIASTEPLVNGAMYPGPGLRLIRPGYISEDNGRAWIPNLTTPDFDSNLPYGYRRGMTTPVVDPNTGRLMTIVNSMDTPGVNPDAIEPPIALSLIHI